MSRLCNPADHLLPPDPMEKHVFFLPGFATTSQIWEPLVRLLPADMDVIPVDWPIDRTPGFHTLNDFSEWLISRYNFEPDSIFIGHSLGGLVGAQLLANKRIPSAGLILVESFLLPPAAFFQNLLMPSTNLNTRTAVQRMLESQLGYYSPVLQQTLREKQFLNELQLANLPFAALYGDRGCRDSSKVLQELSWPADLHRHIQVFLVDNACHFPMLENPARMAEILHPFLTGSDFRFPMTP